MLLLQLRIGLIGLLEKLSRAAKGVDKCSQKNMQGSIFMSARAELSAYLAVGGILLQMNMDTLGDLEEPTPLGL